MSCVTTVRAKHVLLVPDQMSEEEFWKQFFQSQFFHKEAGTSGRSFFSDCLTQEQQSTKLLYCLVADSLNIHLSLCRVGRVWWC